MAQDRLSMRKTREILRLKWECKLPHRAVARSCQVGTGTVTDCLQRALRAGLSWPLPDDLGDDELEHRLFPEPRGPASDRAVPRPMPDWGVVHAELRRKGVTRRLLWLEYRERHPKGLGYSQFCEHYASWEGHLKPSLRILHKAGEKCFVDYAGPTVPVVDPETGEVRQAAVFVGVLGASSYTYAEAHFGQTLPHWIGAHGRMLAFFGGVPEVVVPDNLKSGVRHPCRYEPDLNPTYQDFAAYHGIAVVPARVRKPRDKAKAEVGVQVVERWILARLRHRTFFCLADLNEAIRELLDDLNARPMREWKRSRSDLFETLDRPALRPLPERAYEFALLRHAKVGVDSHVEFDDNFYSVPFALVGQPVVVRAAEFTVEILHKGTRVASHRRSLGSRRLVTLDDHRPPNHKAYVGWSPERFLRWAQKIGPATAQVIHNRLTSREHPEQSFRSCLGVLTLAKRVGDARLEAACSRALRSGLGSWRHIKNILDHHFDQLELDLAPPAPSPTPAHENVRGTTYYN
jgi:transposase